MKYDVQAIILLHIETTFHIFRLKDHCSSEIKEFNGKRRRAFAWAIWITSLNQKTKTISIYRTVELKMLSAQCQQTSIHFDSKFN